MSSEKQMCCNWQEYPFPRKERSQNYRNSRSFPLPRPIIYYIMEVIYRPRSLDKKDKGRRFYLC